MPDKKKQTLTLVIAGVFILLFFRLVQLQIIEGNTYRKLAIENAAKTVVDPAPRGVIYDRNGKVMVENRPVFFVQIMPYLLPEDPLKKKDVLGKLGALLGEKVEYKFSANRPIIIKDNIAPETAFRIEELKNELEGVVVSSRPVRFYPHGRAAAHLLGYTGEIESDELTRLREKGYRRGDFIGKDGVEKIYDQEIRGKDGGKRIEVDVHGNPLRLLDSLDPIPGADVSLTIDLEMQLAAEELLAGKEGAIIVLDPNSGEVLALASHPNYDPNLFIDVLDKSKWRALSLASHPFMNRALAIYPAGSIFKPVVLLAALEEEVARPEEVRFCPGYYQMGKRIAKCWKPSGHGKITVAEGLVQSCDVVFYELGRRLGSERIAKYSRLYGLGEKTGIDLPQEKRGLVPDTEWKKERLKEPWFEGDSINYGIGQGFLQVTPLQMAVLYGTLATGKEMKPFVVKEIKTRENEVLYQAFPQEAGSPVVLKNNLDVVKQALTAVVERGTGRAAKVEGLPAAGKTGTAENPGRPHAWFLCYAPVDNPQIVIAAFVEHGEHGDQVTARIAHDLLAWYKKFRVVGFTEITQETENGAPVAELKP